MGKSEQVDIEDYINNKSGNLKVRKYKKRPKDYKALLQRGREPLKIGYARVSTPQQSLEAQVEELVKAECEVVISEQTSGSFKKPELMFILDNTIAGDELYVWKLDRLGRDNIEQLLILQKFRDKGVQVNLLQERMALDSPETQLIASILSAIGQYEKHLILSRMELGRKRALENGVEFGRPSSFKGRRKELVNLLNKGFTVKEICKTMCVTKSAVYRELEKLRKEGLV